MKNNGIKCLEQAMGRISSRVSMHRISMKLGLIARSVWSTGYAVTWMARRIYCYLRTIKRSLSSSSRTSSSCRADGTSGMVVERHDSSTTATY